MSFLFKLQNIAPTCIPLCFLSVTAPGYNLLSHLDTCNRLLLILPLWLLLSPPPLHPEYSDWSFFKKCISPSTASFNYAVLFFGDGGWAFESLAIACLLPVTPHAHPSCPLSTIFQCRHNGTHECPDWCYQEHQQCQKERQTPGSY